mmetsp:Transcript_35221/g.47302  ORF Transcript_35221/g.47302 Transcript_35221/m.47302 type:complete len:89 (-) Transcript_35221:340-606(-)
MKFEFFSFTFLVALIAVVASAAEVSEDLSRELDGIENEEGKWFEDFEMDEEEEDERVSKCVQALLYTYLLKNLLSDNFVKALLHVLSW